jgi:SWI/SNF-related matrix-associated actin-dependent regulator 1 of chromatin subfamily A
LVDVDGASALKRADELFDPTERELLALLGEDQFPDRQHSTPSSLATLRLLGLRTSLTCQGVLASAASIEALVATSNSDTDAVAVRRGADLLRFLDLRGDDLKRSVQQQHGWDAKAQALHAASLRDQLAALAANHAARLAAQDAADAPEDASAGEARAVARAAAAAQVEAAERAAAVAAWEQQPLWAAEWAAFVAALRQTCWLPVHCSRSTFAAASSGATVAAAAAAGGGGGAAPVSAGGGDDVSRGGNGSGALGAAAAHLPWPKGGWPACLAPCRVRPRDDAWACSFTFGLSAKEVRADATRQLLGWDLRVKPGAVASQLLLLSKAFAAATAAAAAASAHAAASTAAAAAAGAMVVAGTGADPGSAAAAAARASGELRSLRGVLGQEAPKLYRALAASVGTPELASVARALGDRPWLWVGDGFVSTNQVGPLVQT